MRPASLPAAGRFYNRWQISIELSNSSSGFGIKTVRKSRRSLAIASGNGRITAEYRSQFQNAPRNDSNRTDCAAGRSGSPRIDPDRRIQGFRTTHNVAAAISSVKPADVILTAILAEIFL